MVQKLHRRGPQYIVDPLDLVEFVVSREGGEQTYDLEQHTPHPPQIHLVNKLLPSTRSSRRSTDTPETCTTA